MREGEIPLFKPFLGLNDAQLLQINMEGNTEFLTYLAQDKVSELIELDLKKWQENLVPLNLGDTITLFLFNSAATFSPSNPGKRANTVPVLL